MLGITALIPASFIGHLLDLVLFHVIIQHRGMSTYDFLNAFPDQRLHVVVVSRFSALMAVLTCGLWYWRSNRINPCAAIATRQTDIEAGRVRRARHKQAEAARAAQPGVDAALPTDAACTVHPEAAQPDSGEPSTRDDATSVDVDMHQTECRDERVGRERGEVATAHDAAVNASSQSAQERSTAQVVREAEAGELCREADPETGERRFGSAR